MNFDDIEIISPALYPNEQWNEAEVFGAMTWIWLLAENCKSTRLSDMATQVLPVIKSRQFALFSQNSQPLAYISWANLDAQAEAKYVSSEPWIYTQSNWNCGDRMWIINWFAPGQSALVKNLIETKLFPHQCFRALYHKGTQRGMKVLTFKGKSLTNLDAKHWNIQHPILAIRTE